MEVPNIKIKFVSILNKIDAANNEYTLEIVPKVSAIKELNKIEWKEHDDSIEYLIPMTHRIILKKSVTNNVIGLCNAYHSCVDLLQVPSTASITYGSGDVTRSTSENFTFSKLFTGPEKYKVVLTNKCTKAASKENINKISLSAQTSLNFVFCCPPDDNPAIEQRISKTIVISQEDKNTNTEKIEETPILEHQDDIKKKERINVPISDSIENSKILKINEEICDKLNSLPFYSISLENLCNTHISGNKIARPIVFHIYDTFKYNIGSENPYKSHNISQDNRESTLTEIKETQMDLAAGGRVLPEVRVAYLLSIIQKEMSPLQKTLSEIMNKCISLNVNLFQTPLQLSIKCKDRCRTAVNSEDNRFRSNRVVYSVVFDG